MSHSCCHRHLGDPCSQCNRMGGSLGVAGWGLWSVGCSEGGQPSCQVWAGGRASSGRHYSDLGLNHPLNPGTDEITGEMTCARSLAWPFTRHHCCHTKHRPVKWWCPPEQGLARQAVSVMATVASTAVVPTDLTSWCLQPRPAPPTEFLPCHVPRNREAYLV